MAFISRRNALRTLGVLFAISTASDLLQIGNVAVGRADEPLLLVLERVMCAALGGAAAIGLWRGARWAGRPILGWGLITALLLMTLAPTLDLPAEARSGLWRGAAGVLVFAILVAWYARARVIPQPDNGARHGPA